jgi:hypothetical protein
MGQNDHHNNLWLCWKERVAKKIIVDIILNMLKFIHGSKASVYG